MNKMGFGFLRLPMKENGETDEAALNQMVDAFFEMGGK